MPSSRIFILLLAALCLCPAAVAQDNLFELEQKAMRAAVAKVSPSVVQIQTVGGLEQVGNVLFGTGPTTGIVVSEDGYVISSAFNFAQRPTQILVRLPAGNRWPAKLVSTDHARMLVLLKVQADAKEKFVPAVPTPEKEIAVGQWSIALGRTYEGGNINVSEGVISATQRIWGRAMQTDAKVSPSNYGGPLVDIRGRVQGVLVPLSPRGTGKISGVEWYDSGIGFAVPLEHVMKVLPKLKQGDLHAGIMGVSLRPGHPYADPAVIAAVRPNSPAYRAGFKTGDKIVQIGDKEIVRQVQVREMLGRVYGGEQVKVAVLRGKERIERDVELVGELEPYSRPFLGILPMRVAKKSGKKDAKKDDAKKKAEAAGVVVRYIYPGSPADEVGIGPGDVIVEVNGKAVAGRRALREMIAALNPTEKAKLKLRRGDKDLNLEIAVAAQPEAVPAKLPPAMADRKPYLGQQPPVGKQPLKLAEFKNECISYVPGGYDPAVAHGIVLWFHAAGALRTEKQADALVDRWKAHCDAHDLILVAPKSEDPLKWAPAKEVEFVAKLLDKVRAAYNIDNTRIITHGYQGGGAMAYAVAFNQRELVRGIAAVDALLAGRPPEHDPVHPLAFYTTTSPGGRAKPPQVQAVVKRLREMKYPVTVKDLGAAGRYLENEELAELVRWVDALDRI